MREVDDEDLPGGMPLWFELPGGVPLWPEFPGEVAVCWLAPGAHGGGPWLTLRVEELFMGPRPGLLVKLLVELEADCAGGFAPGERVAG